MRSLLVVFLTLTAISTSVMAQAPDSLSHQGLLTDNLGVPVSDGNYNIVFALYDTPSGGSALWSETHNGANAVTTTGGIFNVVLGGLVTLSTVVFNKPMYLGVSVNGDPKMVPRVSLTAVPYARALPGLYTFYSDDGTNESYNVVGGAANNVVGAGVVGATIGGGGGFNVSGSVPDSVMADWATVSGGRSNTASGLVATVGGGDRNTASGLVATVGGGIDNTASSEASTVGGGFSNTASGNRATVGGGFSNTASGFDATIGGGFENTASGIAAVVPGGANNEATGLGSFAAGVTAQALHPGSFVWQDSTGLGFPGNPLSTTAENQFLARASGGFFFYTSSAPNLTTGISLPAGSGTWTALSSESSKNNFSAVNARSYLDRVASLELKEWSYKTEEGVTHVGPMAEDFYAAFGHGPSEKGISGVDGDGVALAAIQGLYELVKEQQTEIEQMRAVMERAGLE